MLNSNNLRSLNTLEDIVGILRVNYTWLSIDIKKCYLKLSLFTEFLHEIPIKNWVIIITSL